MNLVPRPLVFLCLVHMAAAAAAQGAIGNGIPQPRRGKVRPPTLAECIERPRKSGDATADVGATSTKRDNACKRVLAAQADKKDSKSNRHVYEATQP